MNAPKIAALDPLTTAVAAQLRAERAAQRQTVRGAAAKAGMAASTLQRIESAEIPVKMDQLASLAEVYGLSVSEVLRRAERRVATAGDDIMVTRSQELS